jgi:uncharacterized protein (UPF0335 family)
MIEKKFTVTLRADDDADMMESVALLEELIERLNDISEEQSDISEEQSDINVSNGAVGIDAKEKDSVSVQKMTVTGKGSVGIKL